MSNITERELRALSTTDNGRTIYDGHALRGEVRATSKGVTVAFSYRYRFGGKQREYRCGTWPRDKLSTVRESRDAARLQVTRGIDPALARQMEKATREKTAASESVAFERFLTRPTIRTLFDEWQARDLRNRKDAGREVRRGFEKDVLPRIGDTAIEDVRRRDVMDVLDQVLIRGCNRLAKRLLTEMRQMFRYATERELLLADPSAGIAKKRIGGETVERDRVLSNDEIRSLAERLPTSGLSDEVQRAFWLVLSTCCRVGELSRARWTDIDWSARTWTIPKEHAKNGRAHLIHLSALALQQFKTLRLAATSACWVYPNRDDSSHIAVNAIQKQFKDRQRGAVIRGRSKQAGALQLPSGDWRSHDLRRTGATLMGEKNVDSDVIERILNHVEVKATKRIYQRQVRLADRAHALDLLGRIIETLASGAAQDAVVIHGRFGAAA